MDRSDQESRARQSIQQHTDSLNNVLEQLEDYTPTVSASVFYITHLLIIFIDVII